MKNTVYLCDARALCQDTVFSETLENTSDYRKNRILSLKTRKAQNLSLAATRIIDVFLRSLGLCEKQMEYSLNEYGKPFFLGYEDIFFNISHSENYAMCAFSVSPVGCDIQKTKSDKSAALKFLTQDERQYLRERENDEFFRLWALKESTAKAAGIGISAMRSFSIIENSMPKNQVFIEDKKFFLAEYLVTGGYFAAASFSDGELPKQIKTISF